MSDSPSTLRLSVVFVVRHRLANIQKTLECLLGQSAAPRIDLIVSADSPELLDEAERFVGTRSGFADCRFFLDRTCELASARARAAAAPTLRNPNAGSAVSRVQGILHHGVREAARDRLRFDEAGSLPWHSTAYRRTALDWALQDDDPLKRPLLGCGSDTMALEPDQANHSRQHDPAPKPPRSRMCTVAVGGARTSHQEPSGSVATSTLTQTSSMTANPWPPTLSSVFV